RGRDLRTRLARARRSLPRGLRPAAATVADAAVKLDNPRLARAVDYAAVQDSLAALRGHLKAIDPAQRRRDALLHLAGTIVVNLLVLGLLVWAILAWRGFV
ncbi:hypothetical protein, partial [Roseovarius salinarum]|uniref:hypothetical protein n=1 Tax=Roseovarius salinarum TaxID=1981892 RepID=UPI000C32F03C